MGKCVFETIAKIITGAYNRLIINEIKSHMRPEHQDPPEENVPIEEINPYDIVHKEDPTSPHGYLCYDLHETQAHEESIQVCIELIKRGHKILPISIVPIDLRDKEYSGPLKKGQKYQRLDGFKRYMAWKRLAYEKIPCYIFHSVNIRPGNQKYRPWIIG